jgi:hypothetical protein
VVIYHPFGLVFYDLHLEILPFHTYSPQIDLDRAGAVWYAGATLKAMTETSKPYFTDQRIRVRCEPDTGTGWKILPELQAEHAHQERQ